MSEDLRSTDRFSVMKFLKACQDCGRVDRVPTMWLTEQESFELIERIALDPWTCPKCQYVRLVANETDLA